MAKKRIKSFQSISKRIIKRIRLRTWVALGVIVVVGGVAILAYLLKPETKAATMTLTTNDSTTFQVDVSNRYRAVLRKDQTTDYILIYDRAQSDSSPNNTYEFMGPYIREASVDYTLRRDSARVTTLLEATSTRIRVRVTGAFMNEGSAAYLTDGTNNILVTEEYTFTPDGFYVNNTTNFRTSGVALDSATAQDGYNWMMVDADITADGFTGSFAYGNGTTETVTAADADANFEDSNYYGVFPATDATGYQSAMIGIPNDGWFNFTSTTTTTDDWNLDQGNSGSIDRLHARERATTPTGVRNMQWFFFLLDENSLDTETERESHFNDQRVTDLLDWNTGSGWDQEAPYRSNLYYQDGFEVGDHDLCDGDGATWSGTCSTEVATSYRSQEIAAYSGSYGSRLTLAADNGQGYTLYDGWTSTRVASARTMFRATQLGLGDTSDYAQVFTLSDADYSERCRFWVDNNATAGAFRFTTETVNSTGSVITASSVPVVAGQWYNLEIYGMAESAAGANNGSCTYFIDGVQVRQDSSQNFGAGANQTLMEVVNVGVTYMFNPDSGETSIFDYDNVVVIPEVVGVNNWDIGEGTYTGRANNSQVTVDLDGATYNRYNPIFRFKNYRLNSIPSSITVEGTTMTSGNQYNASLKPFTDADHYNNTGTAYTQLASGGDNSLAAEYLNDNSNDATLTFDESSDYIYLGLDSRFSGVYSDLETVGVGSPTFTWEYCSANTDTTTACDTWTTLPVTDSDSATGASTFTRSGHFGFSEPTTWAQATVNSGPTLFYIRGARSAGSYTTYPVENTIRPDILTIQYLGTISSNAQTLTLVTDTNTQTAFWKFDEGVDNTCSGGTNDACDSTKFGNDISRSGALWQKEDVCVGGKCVWFDDSNDNFTRADDNDFDFTASDSFTVTGWFRVPPKTSGTDIIVGKQNASAGWKVQIESDGDLTFGIDDDGTSFPEDSATSTQATYDDDRWHHFAAVKSGTASITLYIDGQQQAQDATLSATGSLANSNALYIGIDGDGTSNPFGGFLDEVRVYPSARTKAEIGLELAEAAANKGSGAVLGVQVYDFLNEGLLGYWKLDETSSTAADSSGHSLTLTNNGTTTYVGAKFGNGSEHVPASLQYLSTATSIANVYSVSFWVNPDSTSTNYINIDGSTYITSSAGTISATGFANAVIYVNGIQSTTIAQDVWQLVTVTTDTAETASAFEVGRANSAYFDGTMDEVRLFNRQLSAGEVKLMYQWAAPPSALWKMDENTGSTTNDSSTNNLVSSAFTGNVAFSPGKYGAGLLFDGTDDVTRFVEAAAIDVGGTTDSYTYSAWAKTSANYSANATIIGKDDGSGAYPMRLYFNSSEQACVQISDGTNAPSACSTPTYSDGAWHHYAGVRDVATDTVYLYVDGVRINTVTDSTTATAANNDDVSIGNSGTSYTGADWNGTIDNAMIYTYSRTAAQIIEDMNAQHPQGGSPIGSQVVYWKFDENYGTTTNNAIPNQSTNGTITNAVWTSSGKVNNALTFDGSGDYVAVATASDSVVDYNGTEPFSMSAWVYVTTMPGASEMDAIIAKWDTTATTRGYRLVVTNDDADTTGNFRVEMYDESTDQTLSAAQGNDLVSTNTWYHVAFSFNGGTAGAAGDLNLYVDGKLTSTNSANASFLGLEDVTADFTVGDYDPGDAAAAATAFTGNIDEVKVYSGVLTADQIKIDTNFGGTLAASVSSVDTPPDGAPANPILYWDFNENTGTTSVNDKSGNGRTGTMNALTEDDWAPGIYGSGLDFDGNEYVSIADADIFSVNNTNQFTVSFWVKVDTLAAQQEPVTKGVSANFEWIFRLETDGSIQAYITQQNNPTAYLQTTFSAGMQTKKWYYIAFTTNISTPYLRLYVDGILRDEDTTTTGSYTNSTGQVQVGERDDGAQDTDGVIDDVKIWNTALTSSQIAFDYGRGKALLKYNMDECSGTTLNNANASSSFTSNGAVTIGGTGSNTSTGNCTSGSSAQAWYNGATGKYGSALSFDGTDDYSDTTDTAPLRFDSAAQDYSTFAWIKRDTTGAMTVISKEDADNDGWRLILTSGNTVQCSVDAVDITSTSTITDTNWHHVGCTIDRDGNGQVYIDGKANGSATAISSEAMANTAAMRIGAQAYSITNYFDGLIDDVEVFNYALTAAQVRKLFNEGSSIRFGANN